MPRLSLLGGVLVLAATTIVTTSAPASADPEQPDAVAAVSGCWGDAGTVGPNPHGYSYGAAKYCHNFRGGDVYKAQYGSFTVPVGYLNAGTNWFVCQVRNNENPPVPEGYRNNIWLYTQADRAYEGTQRGWGEFPANRVSSSTGDYEPIPGLPWCHEVRPL